VAAARYIKGSSIGIVLLGKQRGWVFRSVGVIGGGLVYSF